MDERNLMGLDDECPPILPDGWQDEGFLDDTPLPETGAAEAAKPAADALNKDAEAAKEDVEPAAKAEKEGAERADSLSAELAALRVLYPELDAVPEEVAGSLAAGASLTAAYQAYREKELRRSVEALRKENSVLRRNAENAARSPVRGVTGAAVAASRGGDDFERGFDAGLEW